MLQYFFFGSKLRFGFFRSQIFRICCQFETLTHTFINYTAHSIEVKTQQYTNGSLSRLIGSQITQKILCFYDTCCTTKFSKFNEIKFTSIFYLDSIWSFSFGFGFVVILIICGQFEFFVGSLFLCVFVPFSERCVYGLVSSGQGQTFVINVAESFSESSTIAMTIHGMYECVHVLGERCEKRRNTVKHGKCTAHTTTHKCISFSFLFYSQITTQRYHRARFNLCHRFLPIFIDTISFLFHLNSHSNDICSETNCHQNVAYHYEYTGIRCKFK